MLLCYYGTIILFYVHQHKDNVVYSEFQVPGTSKSRVTMEIEVSLLKQCDLRESIDIMTNIEIITLI